MASSSDRPGSPVVSGRTNPPTNSVKSNKSIKSQGPEKFNSERSVEPSRLWTKDDNGRGVILQRSKAEQTELQDSEATCGQVFIAMNITRGMPWFRREKDPGWFVVGNRRVVERSNRDWSEKKHLQQSCEDITRSGKHHQLFEPEPYVSCKTEKYCGFCLFLVTAVLIIITVAWGALHKHQSNGSMVACGVSSAITTMCCCCMNVRRRRMMDWEVPITEIKRFATIWSKKYGFHLTFESHYDGPSYFILKPKQQASTKSGKDEEQMNQMV